MRALWPLVLLVAAGVTGARVGPYFHTWQGAAGRQGSVIHVLLGDSRRLLANHLFMKADSYFHRGQQPSIFDQAEAHEHHMAQAAGHDEDHDRDDDQDHDHDPASEPGEGCGASCTHDHGQGAAEPQMDWIEKFGRHFYPSEHTELGDGATGLPSEGEEREILPWLKLSVDMDPNRVESYVVAAYWLRTRLKQADEAENFLREGMRHNPDDYVLPYELGQLLSGSRHDLAAARSALLLAVEKWKKSESAKERPDLMALRDTMSALANVEEQDGQFAKAAEYLKVARAADGGSHLYDLRLRRVEEKLKL